MAAKDIIHDAVKAALGKAEWNITHDPFTITFEDATVFVDLGAESVIAAVRGEDKIAVEIKSFIGRSAIQDMEVALGQYKLYFDFLSELEPERRLYVAVSIEAYESVFQRKSIQFLVVRNQIPLIVVDIDREEIVEWID